MVKASRLIGLPVVSLERGTKVGMTKEVWISRDLSKVEGFTVELRRLFSASRFLWFADLFSVANSSLTVRDEAEMEPASGCTAECIRFHSVVSSIVRTRSGNVVGSLSDLFADGNTGHVQELEVSEGVIQDITKGRTRIGRPEGISFNGTAIILPDDAVDHRDALQ